jgi:hypothetical protein
MKTQIKTYLKRAAALAGVAIVALVFAAEDVQALDPKLQTPCFHAFEGKCFRGEDTGLDLGRIQDEGDADSFCDSRFPFCGYDECKDRVKVLANLRRSAERGNPCLSY